MKCRISVIAHCATTGRSPLGGSASRCQQLVAGVSVVMGAMPARGTGLRVQPLKLLSGCSERKRQLGGGVSRVTTAVAGSSLALIPCDNPPGKNLLPASGA